MDIKTFMDAFNQCPVVLVDGRVINSHGSSPPNGESDNQVIYTTAYASDIEYGIIFTEEGIAASEYDLETFTCTLPDHEGEPTEVRFLTPVDILTGKSCP